MSPVRTPPFTLAAAGVTLGASQRLPGEQVLEGEPAVVETEDGPVLELAQGVVGSFAEGERTVWRVRETLRKLYTVALA